MRWKINSDCTQHSVPEIINTLIQQRQLTSTALDSYTASDVGIDPTSLAQAVTLIQAAIANHQPILIYGDYDADGITATAILWETLHHLGAQAIPFIPSRDVHGYGLSESGLTAALSLLGTNHQALGTPLVITVDNGIVAHEPANWLKQQHLPLIITDHHQPADRLPAAEAIVHTQTVSGAGVAWLLSRELAPDFVTTSLDLVAIGTIADMMPLNGINRSFAQAGLAALRHPTRPGISALFDVAGVDMSQPITPYHINYIIAPRLNAMGRLDHALDSLRLLCTRNANRAGSLALRLHDTNRQRQDLTTDLLAYATSLINPREPDPVLVVSHSSFHEGVIGLVAGKLTETFHRPAIVISQKDSVSKASARSIKGVNITELIRSQSQWLLGVGGHPMAAGFSLETNNIDQFKQAIISYAAKTIDKAVFEPVLHVDCRISPTIINHELFNALQALEPFGIGNPQPVFALEKVKVDQVQIMGKQGEHLKLILNQGLTCIWFRPPSSAQAIKPGLTLNLAGTLNQNVWNGRTTLQLIIKDVDYLER